MTTIQSLKNRIVTANNILHITEAMELVSGIQYRKLLKRMEHFEVYYKKLVNIVNHLKLVADVENPLIINGRKSENILIIIIAGDKGLCGSYNYNVLHEAEQLIKSFHSLNVELILLGKKAVNHFKNKCWKIKFANPSFIDAMKEDSIDALSQECITLYLRKEIGELWIVYTHFEGIQKIEPTEYNIVPFQNPDYHPVNEHINYIFDPAPKIIYHEIMSQFFRVKIESLFLESYASELTSRIVAMKTSSKNAKNMIEELTLMKNKLRQLNITKEILEISIGAESIK